MNLSCDTSVRVMFSHGHLLASWPAENIPGPLLAAPALGPCGR